MQDLHDDVIKWKHFPRYCPFVRGIHRSPVNSPHKGQWRGALMFSLICAWIKGWVIDREADDLRRHRGHYDVTVMSLKHTVWFVKLHVKSLTTEMGTRSLWLWSQGKLNHDRNHCHNNKSIGYLSDHVVSGLVWHIISIFAVLLNYVVMHYWVRKLSGDILKCLMRFFKSHFRYL